METGGLIKEKELFFIKKTDKKLYDEIFGKNFHRYSKRIWYKVAYEKQIRQSVLKEKTKLYQVYLQLKSYQKIRGNDIKARFTEIKE